jgi:hypothetical protein
MEIPNEPNMEWKNVNPNNENILESIVKHMYSYFLSYILWKKIFFKHALSAHLRKLFIFCTTVIAGQWIKAVCVDMHLILRSRVFKENHKYFFILLGNSYTTSLASDLGQYNFFPSGLQEKSIYISKYLIRSCTMTKISIHYYGNWQFWNLPKLSRNPISDFGHSAMAYFNYQK